MLSTSLGAMPRLKPSKMLITSAVIAVGLICAQGAFASTAGSGGGAGLPWEGPLQTLGQSFSGPVAFAISLLGIIAAGATLIWGGEVSEFARRMVYLVLVICILVLANSLLTGGLFTGALVPTLDASAHQQP